MQKPSFPSSLKPAVRAASSAAALIAISLSTAAVMRAQAADLAPVTDPNGEVIILNTSLKLTPVPGPTDAQLALYVRDKAAAIRLGKALFWDTKVGSDNQSACASCHFQAGADDRVTNQLNPATDAGDMTFQLGQPNYTVKATALPLTKHVSETTAASPRVVDINDVLSSQGVYSTDYVSIGAAGAADTCASVSDAVGAGGFGFHKDNLNTRRVAPRNTPSVINAVFNFRNFWDGRGNNMFNGGDPFGLRNPNTFIWQTVNGVMQQVAVALPSSSLASQASGPPLSAFEMSCNGRTFAQLGKKLLQLKPLSGQQIDATDSVLATVAAQRAKGTDPTYLQMAQAAFQPSLWNGTMLIALTAADAKKAASMDLVTRAKKDQATQYFTQAESNFSLFFGLALQLYQATLVSNDSPFDRFKDGNARALTAAQRAGLDIFQGPVAKCSTCHAGAEFTNASFTRVIPERLSAMMMTNAVAVYDNGFYNIGVRPTAEDLGVGGKDPFGNPLSESQMVREQKTALLGNNFDPSRNPVVLPDQRLAVDGAFKTPGLRNVELTGPYMHNGGKSTLKQVVDFYARGGDFPVENFANLHPDIKPLALTEPQRDNLVAFMLSLTDDRVKFRKAPFDHPSICIPNGHAQDASGKLIADSADAQKAANAPFRCLPAVGAAGSTKALVPFLGLSPYNR